MRVRSLVSSLCGLGAAVWQVVNLSQYLPSEERNPGRQPQRAVYREAVPQRDSAQGERSACSTHHRHGSVNSLWHTNALSQQLNSSAEDAPRQVVTNDLRTRMLHTPPQLLSRARASHAHPSSTLSRAEHLKHTLPQHRNSSTAHLTLPLQVVIDDLLPVSPSSPPELLSAASSSGGR